MEQQRTLLISPYLAGMEKHHDLMRIAISLADEGMKHNEGGPFGALVVRDGLIVGRGNNQVLLANDPTAHAEVVAIRDACENLETYQLDDCEIYTSCEPCPMCLGAIYWSRIRKIWFACSRKDAAAIGFDDDVIYREVSLDLPSRQIPVEQILRDDAWRIFESWQAKEDKTLY